jgi:hypothetical protein
MKNGQREGMWVVYTDSTNMLVSEKGRYKNGEQVGKWIYNTEKGEPYRIVKYRGDNIRIKGYYPDKSKAEKGQAKIVKEGDKLHFYYYGTWKYYSRDGKLEKTTLYEKGKALKEMYAGGKTVTNDLQLKILLKSMEHEFDEKSRILNEAQQQYGYKSEEYKAKRIENLKKDSTLYARIDSILAVGGYPSKSKVGDENGIIFYIVSFGNWQTKEKYLDVFKLAAAKNDIRLKDLAFFEDKLYVAKAGYQLYGTQGVYDKNYKMVYYPVKNLNTMNERRKAKDLEPVDLSLYTEKTD